MRRAGRAARASLDGSTWRRKTPPLSPTLLAPPERVTLGSWENRERVPEEFKRFGLPSHDAVREAGRCTLVGESGEPVLFSDLVKERGRVVVVFLRHLWCGLCQQYVTALRSATNNFDSLSSSPLPTSTTSFSPRPPPLYIILVSSGSPKLIPIYRTRLDCPFPLYVDGKGRGLYKALGMTKKTLDPGREEEKGSYVKGGMRENVVSSTISGLNI